MSFAADEEAKDEKSANSPPAPSVQTAPPPATSAALPSSPSPAGTARKFPVGKVPPGVFQKKPPSVDPDRTVPNPKFQKYYSDHPNPAQRTIKLWQWWNELPPGPKDQLIAYVYRDFPPLLTPLEDSGEYDYIDKVVEPFENDKDFNDKYGAGDYHVYINTISVPPRTLALGFIKGSRDFKSQPPSDRRIGEMGEDGWPKWIDRNDPQCKTYIEFLRARGVLPELHQIEKEKEKMAQAETTTKLIEQNRELTDKIFNIAEKATAAAAAAPKEAPGASLAGDALRSAFESATTAGKIGNELLRDAIKTMQDTLSTGRNNGPDTAEMLKVAMDLADKMSRTHDASPYVDAIMRLNETVAALKAELASRQVTAQTQQATNGGVSGIKSMVEDLRAVKDLMSDLSGGDGEVEVAKMPWWAGMLSSVMPHLATTAQSLFSMYMLSQQRAAGVPVPQPGASPGFSGVPQQPQPQPAPGNVIAMPMPLAAPGSTDYGTGTAPPPANGAINGNPAPASAPAPGTGLSPLALQILSVIQLPLRNQLRDGLSGADFADWFIGGFGEQVYNTLIGFAEPVIVSAIYASPVAQQITDIPREQVEKFVHEFCTFNPEEYDRMRREGDTVPPSPAS